MTQQEEQRRKCRKIDSPGQHEQRRLTTPSTWAQLLKAPSQIDIRGKRRRLKGFDMPPRPFDFLVVLDFEWTCDKVKNPPPAEIIEFPSVLVEVGVNAGVAPRVVDQFQQYVRPTEQPKLSAFCTELTAITQAQIDAHGIPLQEALKRYSAWLQSHGLVNTEGRKIEEGPTWAVVTWSDADLMSTLQPQLSRLDLPMPSYFESWINLKLSFKSHFREEPHGGLQACVERQGLSFVGRAHSGLVDSVNTAALAMLMVRQGFRFVRTTRGFGPDGTAWGSRGRHEASDSRTAGGAVSTSVVL